MKIFFDINKSIYRYNNDNSLTKITNYDDCDGGICLSMNISTRLEDKNIYTNIFDGNVKTDFIKKELKIELEDYVYSTHNEDDKIFVFGMTKDYYLHLIDGCGFAKVFSLEYLLLKLGYGKNGIISNDIMLLKRYETDDDYRSNYLTTTNEIVYYVGLSIDIYIKNLERILDGEINSNTNICIFSNEILDKLQNISNVSINQFESLIQQYKNFYIVDAYSQRYKKQILHKYMAFFDIFFIVIIATIVFFYLKSIAQEKIYQKQLEEQNIQIEKFEKLNQEILQELPKMDFYKFPLKESRDLLVPFTDYNPTKFIYDFDIQKNNIKINMIVNGISNVEKLVSFLKEKKYENTYIKKDGYNFEFNITIKIKQEKSSKRNQNLKGEK